METLNVCITHQTTTLHLFEECKHRFAVDLAIGDIQIYGLLLVDLCKAFDLVDHKILIKKLKLYKCSSVALNWFESYLRNRKQFVVING